VFYRICPIKGIKHENLHCRRKSNILHDFGRSESILLLVLYIPLYRLLLHSP
jgi:hypothetical protein